MRVLAGGYAGLRRPWTELLFQTSSSRRPITMTISHGSIEILSIVLVIMPFTPFFSDQSWNKVSWEYIVVFETATAFFMRDVAQQRWIQPRLRHIYVELVSPTKTSHDRLWLTMNM